MANTNHSDFPWVEIATDRVSNRGRCIWLNKVPKYLADHWGRVVYRTLFTGPDAFQQHVRQYQSASKYSGPYNIPRLVWDIDADDTEHLDDALSEATDLVRKLQALEVPDGAIQVWFSGRRGFHIETPDLFGFSPHPQLPKVVRKTLTDFWPATDEKPLKRNGLIRARWSAHEKTDLFKVPIRLEELFTKDAEEIMRLARNPRRYETGRKEAFTQIQNEATHPGPILADQKAEVETKEIKAENNTGINRPSDDPSRKITCMHKLWNRGPEEGRRNQDIHEMVRAWRSQGIGSEQCVAMAWAWVKDHNRGASHPVEKGEVQKIVYKVFNKGYTPSCSRDVYEEFCDPRCIFHEKKDFGPKATSLEEETSGYLDRKQHGEQEIINFGDIYPDTYFTVRGGEVVLIVGDTGVGKTSWVQNLVSQWTDPKRQDEPKSVYFNSPEMGKDAMIDRFNQIQFGLSVEENHDQLSLAIKDGWLDEERMQRATSNIHMSTEALSVEEIYDVLAEVRPDVMVIDPLEDVVQKDGGYDRIADQKDLITDLQQIGSKTDTAMLIIHHINKAGMSNDKVKLQDAKGAKAIADKSDFALAFDGSRSNVYRTVRLLKKRRNQNIYLKLEGDPSTWRFDVRGHQSKQLELNQPTPEESGDTRSDVPPEDVEISASAEVEMDGDKPAGIVPDEELR